MFKSNEMSFKYTDSDQLLISDMIQRTFASRLRHHLVVPFADEKSEVPPVYHRMETPTDDLFVVKNLADDLDCQLPASNYRVLSASLQLTRRIHPSLHFTQPTQLEQ